ncbi:MAG: glutamate--tRNA ligase [Deltaproteobacteria bacterium]|nr:glutamate--tRNA ligase [Deltaproteobacteria bacterium]
MKGERKIRTRFAPSPTGYLHIGNARTSLFNFLFAKHHNGSFILRIEDTDRLRSNLEFEASILEDLKWLGLEWNDIPYRQSERLNIYRDFPERLLREGKAYECYCSEERLHELRKKQMSAGMPPRYDGRCRTSPAISEDTAPTIRFKVSDKTIIFNDLIHKKMVFNSKIFGDFIIMGSDGVPTYNFAVVIDDSLMEITHVIRGDDHLSNTPKQILLFEALGFKVPEYAHLPLILGKDATPLSKRHGQFSVAELRKNGFIPAAILNYLCHLGWSPEKEFMSLKEAIDTFSIEKVSKSPSIFDIERLKKFNRIYIEKSSTEYLINNMGCYFDKNIPKENLENLIKEAKKEAVLLGDIPEIIQPFLEEPVFESDAKEVLTFPHTKRILNALIREIDKVTVLNKTIYENIINNLKQKTGEKGKNLFMPIRAALTGRIEGLELEKVFFLLGREKILERIEKWKI